MEPFFHEATLQNKAQHTDHSIPALSEATCKRGVGVGGLLGAEMNGTQGPGESFFMQTQAKENTTQWPLCVLPLIFLVWRPREQEKR